MGTHWRDSSVDGTDAVLLYSGMIPESTYDSSIHCCCEYYLYKDIINVKIKLKNVRDGPASVKIYHFAHSSPTYSSSPHRTNQALSLVSSVVPADIS